jgi:hypothetical protein
VIGAPCEGCLTIADAEDPAASRSEFGALIVRILSSFRTAPAGEGAEPGAAAVDLS